MAVVDQEDYKASDQGWINNKKIVQSLTFETEKCLGRLRTEKTPWWMRTKSYP